MMKVSGIFIYPIKSLRGVSLDSAILTPQGIEHDRRFMLRKVEEDGTRKNMACYYYPLMVRFLIALDMSTSTITVTFHPTNGDEPRSIGMPLVPDVADLDEITISMHGSPTTGYHMGSNYASWFSKCFGYEVELLYVGENRREVLGNLSPNEKSGWLQAAGKLIGATSKNHEQGLGLADCAALLVVSETSLRHVSRMLPPGVDADITKFRPNIVFADADDEYEEDFWSEIDVNGNRLLLTANCNRCVSLNLDYNTGDFGTDESGTVLKKLMAERRVDKGAKYSPVFGRYGFVSREAHGAKIAVRDPAKVSGTIQERTSFYWPYPVPS